MEISKKLKLALRNILLTCGEVETDKAVLLYDGELVVGTEVFVQGEGEDVIPAEDGEYTSEDKIIVVADGKVAEIKDKEEKPEEEPTPEPEEIVVEESAEEEPTEPAADPVDEPETEEETVDSLEDRVAVLEGRIADFVTAIETILNSVSALEGRIAALETKVAKVEETPAADPVDDTTVEEQATHTKAYYLRSQK